MQRRYIQSIKTNLSTLKLLLTDRTPDRLMVGETVERISTLVNGLEKRKHPVKWVWRRAHDMDNKAKGKGDA